MPVFHLLLPHDRRPQECLYNNALTLCEAKARHQRQEQQQPRCLPQHCRPQDYL
jgi:hypothetical protein